MIKFFRHFRQAMIKENRASKYLLYAIGEIVLVVIGILFALRINAWNSDRITQKNIQNYYRRIHVELQSEMQTLRDFSESLDRLAKMNRRTLNILNSQNRDSIPALKKTLGALGTAWTVNLEFSITKEFLNQDYLSKIENDSIKFGLKSLTIMLADINGLSEYTLKQYINTIEPFINTHINYSEVALPVYDKSIMRGGPPTNFELLFGNLEVWNIVTFKLEGMSIDRRGIERHIKKMEWLDKQLLKELGKSE